MVQISGIPLIERIINIFKKNGIQNFLLLGGFKFNELKTNFKNKNLGVNIKCINTGVNTETGGRLLLAKKYINNKIFLMTYGDLLTNFNLTKALKLKKTNNLVISCFNYKMPYGILIPHKQKSNLKEIREKNNSYLINAGFYILDEKIFDFIKSKNESFEKKTIKKMIQSNCAIALNKISKWHPMDTAGDKLSMESFINEL